MTKIACGPTHSMALTETFDKKKQVIYTWGNGRFGKLGHGENKDDQWEPKEL